MKTKRQNRFFHGFHVDFETWNTEKIPEKWGKTGKVREICHSEKVGTFKLFDLFVYMYTYFLETTYEADVA